jgi:hypothetical protein
MIGTISSGLLPIALFVLGLSGLGFAYGVVVGRHEYFPYQIIKQAKDAVEALREKHGSSPDADYTFVVNHPGAGVTVHDSRRAFGGHTFFTAYHDGRHKAKLIDMEGNVLHRWQSTFSEIWPRAPHVIDRARNDHLIHWHGAHLFPNGDILFNFEGGNFPYGGGLVKLDKDSRVIWALPRNTHHDVFVEDDGTIYVPALHFRTERMPGLEDVKPPYYEDLILKISPDGEVLDEISMLRALQDSSYRGLLMTRTSEEDPTHLNTVKTVPAAWADRFPLFDAGDLLVSFRNLNAIAVIDRQTRLVKWAMTGQFFRQHDPYFLSNGDILLYDNWGGPPGRAGRSQILRIDPVSQRIVWRYAGTGERPFFSDIRGKLQPLPNGNVLIVEPEGGRIFEITPAANPEIVWEYCNLVKTAGGEQRAGLISLGRRYRPDELTFLN